MNIKKKKKKVILLIRDGWGYRKEKNQNIISEVKTPNTDKLMKEYPHTLLEAAGEAVGLPAGYQGNSEVGHMTIGAGRVIFQSLERINKSIRDGSFFKNPAFLGAIKNCRKNKSKLHVIGLLQTEAVHSHMNHLFALLELCERENFFDVNIHVITDGRDAPATASIEKLEKLNESLKNFGFGRIATLSGRYYAMDRDKRWERTKKAYGCIAKGIGEEFENAIEQAKKNHKSKETDEFMVPRKLKGYDGIKEHDSVIFYNFRTDRTRQLTQAIVEKNFEGWERKPLNVYFAAMTQYYIPMNSHVAFKDIKLKNMLGEVISRNGIKQLRISETEKYAHVTFFFNGQIEKPYKNEERILVHSPRVATYDLKPEMSAYEITERLVNEINKDEYELIVVNIVNGDMVGHTGNIPAIKKAIAAVDNCIGRIVHAGLEKDYVLLVTADHGNAEDKTEEWRTSHTLNPVEIILVSDDKKLKNCKLIEGKGLRDIAPTILDIINIKKPKEMSGKSIIKK